MASPSSPPSPSQTNVVGTTATFWVEATGTEPLAYQWQKFVRRIGRTSPARTDTTLFLTNVQTSHAGDYRVVVTNVDGAITSDVAHLTILVPPRITYTASLQHQAVDIGIECFVYRNGLRDSAPLVSMAAGRSRPCQARPATAQLQRRPTGR